MIRYKIRWTAPNNAVIILSKEKFVKELAYYLLSISQVSSVAYQGNRVFVTVKALMCLECAVEEFYAGKGVLAISRT